jgi:hypothetical protein
MYTIKLRIRESAVTNAVMFSKKSIKSYTGVIVLAIMATIIGTAIHVVWPKYKKLITRTGNHAEIDELINLINSPAHADFHHRVDDVRTFVSNHSVHKIDSAFYEIRDGRSPYSFAHAVIAHAKDSSVERVHMECASRADLMADILNQMGYEVQKVALFDTHDMAQLASHAFLEVLNPETKKWEAQMPDYNVYWRSISSHERISISEDAENLADVEPCWSTSCGWHHRSSEGLEVQGLLDYFDIISVNWTRDEGHPVYSVYTQRADLGRIYTPEQISAYVKNRKGGRFCEAIPYFCRDGLFAITSVNQQTVHAKPTFSDRLRTWLIDAHG